MCIFFMLERRSTLCHYIFYLAENNSCFIRTFYPFDLPSATRFLFFFSHFQSTLLRQWARKLILENMNMKQIFGIIAVSLLTVSCLHQRETAGRYKGQQANKDQNITHTTMMSSYNIVDTGVKSFYNNRRITSEPKPNEPFYGQDTHHQLNIPS